MANPVFSTQFILYEDAAPNTTFDVPTGFTAVIRDFTAYATVAAGICQVLIQNALSAPTIAVAQLEPAGIATYEQWTGRVVVPEEGIITLDTGGITTGFQCYVGGYLLANSYNR